MTPYLEDADFVLYQGNAHNVLLGLRDASVNCCVTSPPYWGLRDYGTPGQLGLEQTPELYVQRLVRIMAEVKRVLTPDGTCWLNLGDSYVSDPGKGGSGTPTGRNNRGENYGRKRMATVRDTKAVHADILRPYAVDGLRAKNMVGIPWRVALALQADGWYLRSDIIWSKPNPMPESVTDRPTRSHEYLFLLTKSAHYYFDQEAVREPYVNAKNPGRGMTATDHYGAGNGGNAGLLALRNRIRDTGEGRIRDVPQEETLDGMAGETPRGPDGRRKTHVQAAEGSIQHRDGDRWPNEGRNLRSVWELPTLAYPGAHFATFPPELPRRCIAAGCPEQVCATCGKARERIVERGDLVGTDRGGNYKGREAEVDAAGQNRMKSAVPYRPGMAYEQTTVGWSDCGHNSYRPGLVLDPFAGAGTTNLVARQLGRRSLGIEINPAYCELISDRLRQLSLLTAL